MKRKILIGIIIGIFSLSLISCGNNEDTGDNSTLSQESTQTEDNITENTLELYYEADEEINHFLNNYNIANPDTLIEIGTFEVYNHHGSDHENQIVMYRDDLKIVMSNLSSSYISIPDHKYFEVSIHGKFIDNETYKELFRQFAKGYDVTLNDETLDIYWTALWDDTINCVEFDEFECDLTINNDSIQSILLAGKIK